MTIKKTASDITYTVLANILKLLTTFVLTLVAPHFLGQTQYGYWQLFLLYTTYMGYSHLGVADGIYLREGGKRYSEINQCDISSQLSALFLYEAVLAGILILCAFLFSDSGLKTGLLALAAIDMILYAPRQTMKLVLQATGRIKEFAVSVALFVTVSCAAICLLLIIGIRDVRCIALAYVLTELLALAYTAYVCRGLWAPSFLHIFVGLKACVRSAAIGVSVLFAGAASTLSLSMIRSAIEKRWGIEQFGSVSLALSISKLFLVFINSVSVVLFPILRRADSDTRKDMYITLRVAMTVPFWLILAFYVFIRGALCAILPQYAEAMRYVTLLVPMCLYECIMALLCNTYLKTLRKERSLLLINLISVIISLFVCALTLSVSGTIELSILLIAVIVMLRTIIGEYVVCRYLGIFIRRMILADALMSVAFITVHVCMQGVAAMITFAAVFLFYCFIGRRDIQTVCGKLHTSILSHRGMRHDDE